MRTPCLIYLFTIVYFEVCSRTTAVLVVLIFLLGSASSSTTSSSAAVRISPGCIALRSGWLLNYITGPRYRSTTCVTVSKFAVGIRSGHNEPRHRQTSSRRYYHCRIHGPETRNRLGGFWYILVRVSRLFRAELRASVRSRYWYSLPKGVNSGVLLLQRYYSSYCCTGCL